jgi:hypothetical protein
MQNYVALLWPRLSDQQRVLLKVVNQESVANGPDHVSIAHRELEGMLSIVKAQQK